MEQVIVYVDDAIHARQQLAALRGGGAHWLLVACPPRMSQRIGKWASRGAGEKWRRQWSARLFSQLVPWLQSGHARVTPLVAQGPLPALTQELVLRHGACRVLDARRPRSGQSQRADEEREPLQGAPAGVGAAVAREGG